MRGVDGHAASGLGVDVRVVGGGAALIAGPPRRFGTIPLFEELTINDAMETPY